MPVGLRARTVVDVMMVLRLQRELSVDVLHIRRATDVGIIEAPSQMYACIALVIYTVEYQATSPDRQSLEMVLSVRAKFGASSHWRTPASGGTDLDSAPPSLLRILSRGASIEEAWRAPSEFKCRNHAAAEANVLLPSAFFFFVAISPLFLDRLLGLLSFGPQIYLSNISPGLCDGAEHGRHKILPPQP
jgi:hypothetical protein